jgi:hypothetical protein
MVTAPESWSFAVVTHDTMQQMNKGKMVLGMVAEVLPVPDSIRTTLSRLIDLI